MAETDSIQKSTPQQNSQGASAKQGRRMKDTFFLTISIIVGSIVVIFIRDAVNFRMTVPANIEIKPLTDFAWIGLAAGIFNLSKRVFDWTFFKPLFKKLQSRNLQDIEVVKFKLTKNLFDATWYMLMFIFGLVVANGDPNMPFFYLGSGSWDSLGNNWPRHNFGILGRIYFIMHLGHHYHNLVYHTVTMKDIGNYQELILHHVVTASSTTLAYYINFDEYALFTLLSHDLSDSILNFAKFLRDMGANDIYISFSFITIVVSWVYMRLVLASQCYWIGTQRLLYWKEPYEIEFSPAWNAVKYSVNIVCVETLLLVTLNLIWLYWILQVAYRKIFKGANSYSSINEGEADELRCKNAEDEKKIK